jgi:hypothetical protein
MADDDYKGPWPTDPTKVCIWSIGGYVNVPEGWTKEQAEAYLHEQTVRMMEESREAKQGIWADETKEDLKEHELPQPPGSLFRDLWEFHSAMHMVLGRWRKCQYEVTLSQVEFGRLLFTQDRQALVCPNCLK